MSADKETPGRNFYCCVHCNNILDLQANCGLVCGVCEVIYLLIEGVKMLVSNPTRFLQSTFKKLSGNRTELTESKAILVSLTNELHSQDALYLANKGHNEQMANLKLIN